MNGERAYIFAQIGVLCAVLSAMYVLPGAPVFRTVLLLAAVWALTSGAYSLSGQARSPLARWTLLAAFALLSLGLVANVHYFTARCGALSTAPLLLNDDASVAWQVMSRILDGGRPDESITVPSRYGYGRFLAFAALFVGRDVAALLTVNVLFVMLTIVLTGRIAAMLAPAGMERRMSGAAMLMIASVCYFLASGVILIKDAACCFVMAVSLWGLLRLRRGGTRLWTAYAGLAGAAALAAVVRPSLLLFMVMGFAALTPWRSRRAAIQGMSLALLLVGLYSYVVLCTVSTYNPGVTLSQTEDMALQVDGASTDRMQAYTSVAGMYYLYSPFERLMRLPMSLAVQFMTPFPWNYTKHIDFGYSLVYSHFAWPWYAVGAMFIYYLIFCLRRGPRLLSKMALLGAAMTAAVAMIYGGLVSRYCLPWLPAIVPAAAAVWLAERHRRRFKVYVAVFAVLLCAALFMCHRLLQASGGAAVS